MKLAASILASAILFLSAGCSDDMARGRADNRPFPGVGRNYQVMGGGSLVDRPFQPNSTAFVSPGSMAPSGGPMGDPKQLAEINRMIMPGRSVAPASPGTGTGASPAAGLGQAPSSGSPNVNSTPVGPPGRP
jgi:hypothetical protein